MLVITDKRPFSRPYSRAGEGDLLAVNIDYAILQECFLFMDGI